MKNICGHRNGRAQTAFRVTAALLALLCVALMAGCGGGGGGGGSSSGGGSSNFTFSGTVTNTASSAGAAGFTIRFDTSGPKTTTSSAGTFSLSVPSGDITGSDTIYVLDSNGFVVGSQSVTNDAGGAIGIQINVGPPPAPPLAIKA